MRPKKLLGILMLAGLFIGLFVSTAYMNILMACVIFGLAILLVVFVITAVHLIDSD